VTALLSFNDAYGVLRVIMGACPVRSLGPIAVLAALLCTCWPAAGNAQIKDTSTEGQNITKAAEFIRSMGMDEAAGQILQALKDGDIYQDDLSGGDLGKTSPATKNITIDNGVLGTGGPGRTTLFTDKFHFGQIFHLAMVLYHENVHRHQAFKMRVMSLIGKQPDEYEAWTRTLAATSEWIDTLWKEYGKAAKADKATAASKLNKATTFLAAEADSFITEHKAYGYPQAPWKKFQKLTKDLSDLAGQLAGDEAQGKDTQDLRPKISEAVRDTIVAEKGAIGDLPKPKSKAAQPPRRISERPRKQAPTKRGRIASALSGGHCPGGVRGATLRQADPDANVVLAMVRECMSWNASGAP
jgi:hypothetical protein